MSTREKIYNYIAENGCKSYSTEELRATNTASSWARVVRQLRQDGIIKYTRDNSNKLYLVTEINPYTSTSKRSGLNTKDLYRIRNRDGHRCQSCGKASQDGVQLHVDHKVPVEWGGTDLDNNLWILCDICNQGKKDFFRDDFDPEVMKLVNQERYGYQKMKVLFENSKGVKFTPSILQGIAGIRDWTRTLRDLRQKHGIKVRWVRKEEDYPNGYYIVD